MKEESPQSAISNISFEIDKREVSSDSDDDDDAVGSSQICDALQLMKPKRKTTYQTCFKCNQIIREGDLFCNLPSLVDMERRRLWCERLHIDFNDSLHREAAWFDKVLCTNHFRKQDLELYPTKSALEHYAWPEIDGIRSEFEPRLLFTKRSVWSCTVCSFTCFSVCRLYWHVQSIHISLGKSNKRERPTTANQEYMCPFCRKCAYGYRTRNGFLKHFSSPPCEHYMLKKVFDSALRFNRDHFLTPSYDWNVWTEKNVCMAVYGKEFGEKITEAALAEEESNSSNAYTFETQNGGVTATALMQEFPGTKIILNPSPKIVIKQEQEELHQSEMQEVDPQSGQIIMTINNQESSKINVREGTPLILPAISTKEIVVSLNAGSAAIETEESVSIAGKRNRLRHRILTEPKNNLPMILRRPKESKDMTLVYNQRRKEAAANRKKLFGDLCEGGLDKNHKEMPPLPSTAKSFQNRSHSCSFCSIPFVNEKVLEKHVQSVHKALLAQLNNKKRM